MTQQSLVIIDDFYENPEDIRRKALSLDYVEKKDASYPGKEAFIKDHDWTQTRNKLSKYIIDDKIDGPSPKVPPFIQGKFRIAMAEDQQKRPDFVHEDVQKWSAVIYLSLPEHCQGGVAFYKHKKTGCVASSHTWFKETFATDSIRDQEHLKAVVREHFKTQENWEKIWEVPMAYNRAVILMAHCFHGSTGVFGATKESARLTQHFEYYS